MAKVGNQKGSFGGVRYTWNAQAVADALDKVRADAFRVAGFALQNDAKKSMKKRTKKEPHSAPGNPPKVKTGGLKNSIRFAWDPETRSIVVGPIRLNNRSEGANALEFGGSATVTQKKKGRIVTVNGRFRKRPYMNPALLNTIPKMARFIEKARSKFK